MAKIVLTDESGPPTTPAAGVTVIYTEAGVLYVLNSTGTPAVPLTSTLFSADGDMLYRNGASAIARLPIGTNGQLLVATTAGADVLPVWTTPTAALVGALDAAILTADGDILHRNGAGATGPLAIGAPGQALVATTAGPDVLPVWTTLTAGDVGALPATGYTVELQIVNGRSSIVVGEVDAGGHPFDPTRYAVAGTTTVLTLEVHAYITNAVGVTGTFRLYDGGGVLRATLTWAGAPGVVGSTEVIAVVLPAIATNYTATMDVVGGDGILDTMHIDSAALVVTHT